MTKKFQKNIIEEFSSELNNINFSSEENNDINCNTHDNIINTKLNKKNNVKKFIEKNKNVNNNINDIAVKNNKQIVYNSFASTQSYNKLFNSLKDKKFPIVVFGSSGTGKSFTIKQILDILGYKYKHVDISLTTINKPLIPIIHLVEITDTKELEKINYFDNLIIETHIEYLSKIKSKINNIQLSQNNSNSFEFNSILPKNTVYVKFNKVTLSRFKSICNKNFNDGNLFKLSHNIEQKRLVIEYFSFLRKLFKKNISIKNLSVSNNLLYLDYLRQDKEENTESGSKKNSLEDKKYLEKNLSEEIIVENEENNILVEWDGGRNFIESDSTIIYQNIKNKINCKNEFKESNSISYDSQEADILSNDESNVDDFVDFSSSFNDDCLSFDEENINCELLEEKDILNEYKIDVIFDYLYSNVLDYIKLEDLPMIYDSISRSDLSSEGILLLLKNILDKSVPNGRLLFHRSIYKYKNNL